MIPLCPLTALRKVSNSIYYKLMLDIAGFNDFLTAALKRRPQCKRQIIIYNVSHRVTAKNPNKPFY